MTGGWILIIMLHTTGGKFVDKIELGPFATKQACQAVKLSGINQFKKNRVCVSQAHFEGRDIDPGITPD
jgi:hypothetical protein